MPLPLFIFSHCPPDIGYTFWIATGDAHRPTISSWHPGNSGILRLWSEGKQICREVDQERVMKRCSVWEIAVPGWTSTQDSGTHFSALINCANVDNRAYTLPWWSHSNILNGLKKRQITPVHGVISSVLTCPFVS